jgi:hypothetical protein
MDALAVSHDHVTFFTYSVDNLELVRFFALPPSIHFLWPLWLFGFDGPSSSWY